MNKEDNFLKLALEYKEKYKATKWWKFKKRNDFKKSWISALECMVRYGNK